MTLNLVNPTLVTGTYESSTGFTGTYEVIGYQTTAEPTPNAGQAVSLAIDRHSIVAGPPDNSWHWVSGLSGQISIQNGVEQLVLLHALVASIEFPGPRPLKLTSTSSSINASLPAQHNLPRPQPKPRQPLRPPR
jgi:hypothetical protein